MNSEKTCKEVEVRGGVMKKRDKIVASIADSFGMQLAADVLTLEDMEGFPDISGENDRNQCIMALHAIGMPYSMIASSCGGSRSSICQIISRIDPNGVFKLDPNAKKAVMTRLAESRAISAIGSISLEDLLALDADKRANVAAKMVKISQDLNQSKHKESTSGKLDLMLERALSQMDEADVEDVSVEDKK